ncbi:hypothetical protein PSHT_02680 [Puccinia striiformis]|uniref:Uncharacterized protein n=1 Tax=Puccinia striiformis TaxID=27350 RepID=A0A2S4WHJ3_9BASI|nr:hypothetical protein PSHT_02680 [Puccinia striiformis]
MDALAITPVCLLGYVPLLHANPSVTAKRDREIENEFSTCLCSNCDPESAKHLISALKYLNLDDFNENIINRQLTFTLPVMPPPPKVTKPRACINKKTGKKPLDGELENLAVSLVKAFLEYHTSQISCSYSEFKSRKHFRLAQLCNLRGIYYHQPSANLHTRTK